MRASSSASKSSPARASSRLQMRMMLLLDALQCRGLTGTTVRSRLVVHGRCAKEAPAGDPLNVPCQASEATET